MRIRSVDIFKAVGIICMLFSHTTMCEQSWTNYYNCFYMPMFFCISGYFYHETTLLTVVRKKTKSLLIPYFFIGTLGIIIHNCFLSGKIPLINSLDALFLHSNSDDMPIVGAIWFLMALFWVEIIFTLLKKFHSETILFLGCVILAGVGCSMRRFTDFRPIWCLDSAMTAMGFMYIGYLTHKFRDSRFVKRALNMPFYIIIPLLIVNIYMASITYITMWRNSYNNIPLLWINAVVACIIWYNISRYIDNARSVEGKWLADILSYIGSNSIVFLCFNQLVLLICKRTMAFAFGWPTRLAQQRVWFAVFFVFTLLALMGIAHLNIRRKQLLKYMKQRLIEVRHEK